MDRIIIAIVAFYLGMKYANMPATQQQQITGELIPTFPGSPFAPSGVATAENPSGQTPGATLTLTPGAQALLGGSTRPYSVSMNSGGMSGFGYMRNYIPGSGMIYGHVESRSPIGYDRSFTVQNYTNADFPGGHKFSSD